MKKVILVSFLLFCPVTNSQPSFNLFSGYGKTVFENTPNQAEYLPVGTQLMFGVPIINFGIEASYSLTPIIYDVMDLYSQNYSKQIKFSQFYIGSIVKINLTGGSFIPYLRIGTGLYTGKEKVTWTKEVKKIANDSGKILEDYKTSLKNKIGMNLGGGFSLDLWGYSGLFFEYIYHFISRQENVPGGVLFKADNWTFSFGYVINFL